MIAGDAPEPLGPYEGALPFIRDFLDADPGVERVGVTGYPDGHAMIDERGRRRPAARQTGAARRVRGIDGWVSTQMCFDDGAIRRWIRRQRERRHHAAGPARRPRRRRPDPADDDGHPARYRRLDALPGEEPLDGDAADGPGGYDPTRWSWRSPTSSTSSGSRRSTRSRSTASPTPAPGTTPSSTGNIAAQPHRGTWAVNPAAETCRPNLPLKPAGGESPR